MKKNRKHISLVVDRSGSMIKLQESTINGYNTFIKTQQDDKDVETTVSTLLFDHEYIQLHDKMNVKNIKKITSNDYWARGMTALYDALGKAIIETGKYLSSLKEEDRPSKVIFVVITDGNENSSKEFTENQVKEMIKHQTEVYNWEFIYLGANVDAFSNASKLNIGTYSNYSASADGTRSVYTTLGNVAKKRGTINNSDLKGIV